MLESALESFHILHDQESIAMAMDEDDDNHPPHHHHRNASHARSPTSSLQRTKSYFEQHAISNPHPRLLYSPPVNFGMVTHNLYRSSFPQKENFAYIRKLGLKSVLYVLPPYFSGHC
jgi:hypothetical protein